MARAQLWPQQLLTEEMKDLIFFKISPELREKIFNYLAVKDLTSLQCCNSFLRKTFQCYTWETVRITPSALTEEHFNERIRNKLKYLINAKTLYLADQYTTRNYRAIESFSTNWNLVVNNSDPTTLVSHYLPSGAVQSVVDRLSNLVHLDIRGICTEKSEVGNDDISLICNHLLKLKVLKLYRLGFTDEGLTDIHKLHELEFLDIGCNNITDCAMEPISRLPKLIVLKMQYCRKITKKGLFYFDGNSSLRRLKVIRSDLDDDAVLQIGGIKKLRFLELGWNRFGNTALKGIGKLLYLSHLSITDSKVLTDVGIINLSSLLQLLYLQISAVGNVTGKGFPVFKKLKLLDISYCNVTNEGVWNIAQNKSLEELNLSANSITDDGYVHLCVLVHLTHLAISCCGSITNGAFMNKGEVDKINIPPMLKKLEVGGTQITSDFRAQIRRLKAIVITTDRWPWFQPPKRHIEKF